MTRKSLFERHKCFAKVLDETVHYIRFLVLIFFINEKKRPRRVIGLAQVQVTFKAKNFWQQKHPEKAMRKRTGDRASGRSLRNAPIGNLPEEEIIPNGKWRAEAPFGRAPSRRSAPLGRRWLRDTNSALVRVGFVDWGKRNIGCGRFRECGRVYRRKGDLPQLVQAAAKSDRSAFVVYVVKTIADERKVSSS